MIFRIILFFVFTCFFFGCRPYEYPPLQTGFYSVDLDATSSEIGDGYYIVQVEDYLDTVLAGTQKSIGFEYFSGVICQKSPGYIPSFCLVDSTSSTLHFDLNDQPLKDLIHVVFMDVDPTKVQINRSFPLTDNIFTVKPNIANSSYFLPAILNELNTILVFDDTGIILDTTFFVGNDFVTIVL